MLTIPFFLFISFFVIRYVKNDLDLSYITSRIMGMHYFLHFFVLWLKALKGNCEKKKLKFYYRVIAPLKTLLKWFFVGFNLNGYALKNLEHIIQCNKQCLSVIQTLRSFHFVSTGSSFDSSFGQYTLFSRMVICPSNLVFEYKFFWNANQTMFSYLNFKRIFTRKRGWTGILPYVRRAYLHVFFC